MKNKQTKKKQQQNPPPQKKTKTKNKQTKLNKKNGLSCKTPAS
jgi:hypothetical protein